MPSGERLQSLIRALLETGALTRGRELSEARELWAAVERDGTRLHGSFDTYWFVGLLASQREDLGRTQCECLRSLRGDRLYERMDTTGLTGVTDAHAQRCLRWERSRLRFELSLIVSVESPTHPRAVSVSFFRTSWRMLPTILQFHSINRYSEAVTDRSCGDKVTSNPT